MKVLAIGDVISDVGCEFLAKQLPNLKAKYKVDVVIVNGENSAVGNGITPTSANKILDCGVDVITTGNHTFKRKEILSFLDETNNVIRPANIPYCEYGNGYYIIDLGRTQLCVISLIGRAYIDSFDCPFRTVEEILKKIETKNVIIDFHAEATGEKGAIAYYFDGKVSAIFGTHTHVQTADEQILDNGTGFITDIGMTGPIRSILGVKPECIIYNMRTRMPTRFEVENIACKLEGVVIEIDEATGKCIDIKRVQVR
jgi:metallophosphoesterase (TIGR00282 family)